MATMSLPRTSIAILDASIKLLSISKQQIQAQMFNIMRALVFRHQLAAQRGSDPFFNLTFNEIELSIFADAELVDRVFGEQHPSSSELPGGNGTEISQDIWIPLQVEQHDDDSWDRSGVRLKEISAPLAAEGISILFLSTYISDFLLIKEHRIELAVSILQKESFYSHDPAATSPLSGIEDLRSPLFPPLDPLSPITSPGSSLQSHLPRSFTGSLLLSDKDRGNPSTRMERTGSSGSQTGSPARLSANHRAGSALLSRSRPGSLSRSRKSTQDSSPFEPSPFPSRYASEELQFGFEEEISPAPSDSSPLSPGERLPALPDTDGMQDSILSDSTTASGIIDKLVLLPDELVCVGLSMSHERLWRSKIVQALYYHEDVMPSRERQTRRASESSSRTGLDNDENGTNDDSAHLSSSLTASQISLGQKPTLYSTTPTPQRPGISSDQISSKPQRRTFSSSSTSDLDTLSSPELCATSDAEYPTPFLSLTLTAEGGSLIADIRLLRALFDGEEDEGMIYASGQGGLSGLWSGEEGDREASMAEPSFMRGRSRNVGSTSSSSSALSDDGDADWQELSDQDEDGQKYKQKSEQEYELELELEQQNRRLFKCLQLDLSSFGLEKAGLASQFAGLLTDVDINLLYSSTFRTANILVAKRDIRKARMALESAA